MVVACCVRCLLIEGKAGTPGRYPNRRLDVHRRQGPAAGEGWTSVSTRRLAGKIDEDLTLQANCTFTDWAFDHPQCRGQADLRDSIGTDTENRSIGYFSLFRWQGSPDTIPHEYRPDRFGLLEHLENRPRIHRLPVAGAPDENDSELWPPRHRK